MDAVNIIFLGFNAIILYFTFIYGRKKAFEDDLYMRKLDAFIFLSTACYSLYKKLDINSTPFVQIYDFKSEDQWIKHCEKTMGEYLHFGFDLQENIYNYAVYLPNSVLSKLVDFSNNCISFVTMSYQFNELVIIENQERLWDLYIELLSVFREDLKIEAIDNSLQQRMAETMNIPEHQ